DFVARPYHIYHGSMRAYVEWEDPPEPPEELEKMRGFFRGAIGEPAKPRDVIVETVLARTLLEPTGKTYFDEIKRRFIVVEPKLISDDVQHWAALSRRESG